MWCWVLAPSPPDMFASHSWECACANVPLLNVAHYAHADWRSAAGPAAQESLRTQVSVQQLPARHRWRLQNAKFQRSVSIGMQALPQRVAARQRWRLQNAKLQRTTSIGTKALLQAEALGGASHAGDENEDRQVMEAVSMNDFPKLGLRRFQDDLCKKIAEYNKTMPGWEVPTVLVHPIPEAAALNRTKTWDKAPLQGDKWLENLLCRADPRLWKNDSTPLDDCDCETTASSGFSSHSEHEGDVLQVITDDLVDELQQLGGSELQDATLLDCQNGGTDCGLREVEFSGVWNKACIHDGVLTWNEGEDVTITITSSKSFHMTYCGMTCCAELRDSKLWWDDGEVWQRSKAQFDGHWTKATIEKGILTWKEGEEVAIQTLSANTFQMWYLGVNCTAEMRDDGKLHWDDGDLWTRQETEVQQMRGARPPWCRVGQIPRSVVAKQLSSERFTYSSVVAKQPAHKQAVAIIATAGVRQVRGKSVLVSMPVDEKRYQGVVTWFRGSYGWLECPEVAARYPNRAIFVHFNDCDLKPCQGDKLSFQLSLDVRPEYQHQVKAVCARKVNEDAKQVISARDFIEARSTERRRMTVGSSKAAA